MCRRVCSCRCRCRRCRLLTRRRRRRKWTWRRRPASVWKERTKEICKFSWLSWENEESRLFVARLPPSYDQVVWVWCTNRKSCPTKRHDNPPNTLIVWRRLVMLGGNKSHWLRKARRTKTMSLPSVVNGLKWINTEELQEVTHLVHRSWFLRKLSGLWGGCMGWKTVCVLM